MNPEDLKYTQEHEWLRLEDDLAVVGITDFAQTQLGDVVYLELTSKGATVEQNQPFGSIDSVKTASDLFSPVSGEVVEVNESVNDNPDLVNSDPYGAGWMIRIRPSDASQIEKLMSATEYEEYTKDM